MHVVSGDVVYLFYLQNYSFFSFFKLLSFCCLWTGLYIVAGYAEEIMVCCSFSLGIHIYIYKHEAYSFWIKWTFFPQMPSFHNLFSDKAPHYCSFLNFIVWEWNTAWWLWDIYLSLVYVTHTEFCVCVLCVCHFVCLCGQRYSLLSWQTCKHNAWVFVFCVWRFVWYIRWQQGQRSPAERWASVRRQRTEARSLLPLLAVRVVVLEMNYSLIFLP